MVLRDMPVRRAISRVDSFSRSAIRRMMFKSPMCITPMSPIAHRAGGKVTWLKFQWKLSAYPAHFRVEIYTITAVMRRIVVLANTLLREERDWQPKRP